MRMTNISPINLFSGHLSYDCVNNEENKMLNSDVLYIINKKKTNAIISRISGLVISSEPFDFHKKNHDWGREVTS